MSVSNTFLKITIVLIISIVLTNGEGCDDCEALYLTPYIEEGRIDEARTLAQVHHEDFQDVQSYSGFFNVDKRFNSQMYFWFFPSLLSSDVPIILWIEGGSGFGNKVFIYPNGPFQIIDGKVSKRSSSWIESYNLLYVGNPFGFGYTHSSDEYSLNPETVRDNLYSTLQQFYTIFPELQKNELYILGENYGAKYMIHLCHKICEENQQNTTKINLQGFGMIGGIFDPINQIDYGDNLYDSGLIDEHGLVEFTKTSNKIKEFVKEEKWNEAIDVMDHPVTGFVALFEKYMGSSFTYNLMKSEKVSVEQLHDSISQAVKYMDRNNRALHVGNITFDVTYKAAQKLFVDFFKSAVHLLPEVLKHYRGVVVTGQLDLLTSYRSTNKILNNLNFSASEEWTNAKRNRWNADGDLCGYYKIAGNLTEVLVLNSGHMIPLDQPSRVYDIVNKLTRNSWTGSATNSLRHSELFNIK